MRPVLSMCWYHMREMSANNIRASRQRLVRLIDRISTQHNGVAADSRLRIHHSIAANDRGAPFHAAAQVEAAEQHKNVPRQVALHLHRAEDAGRVMHLLA